MSVEKKIIANKVWFSIVSTMLILAGIVFAFLGLGILPVRRDVLLQ